MDWFYLALLAPLIFSVVNLLDDNLLRSVYKSPHVGTIVSGLFAGLPLLVLPFVDLPGMDYSIALLATLTGIFNVCFIYYYFVSLDKESPSTVVAILGLAPALLPGLAAFFLNEQLTSMQLFGLLLVLIGSIGLSIKKDEKLAFTKALRPLIVASVLLCVNSLVLKYVYERADFLSVYLLFSLGMMLGGALFIFILLARRQDNTLNVLRYSVKKYFPLFLLTELIAISAEFVSNLAISKGPVSAVRIIENIQPLYVLLIAVLLYPFWPHLFREAKEGSLLRKFALMIVIVVGLALVEISSS